MPRSVGRHMEKRLKTKHCEQIQVEVVQVARSSATTQRMLITHKQLYLEGLSQMAQDPGRETKHNR